MATAALVCGILGLIGGFIPVIQYFTLVLSIVAIILGIKAKKDLQEQSQPTGTATAGMVLGIISVAITVISIIAVAACAGSLLSLL
ncbi:MAG: DUF4190 domain-containing protein [Clostridiales bacterium]|nr:DUF4190 domain-containing protein [Clostridiales bacterium]